MWEQIRSNKRKSATLVLVMALLLMALGFSIGQGIFGGGGPSHGDSFAMEDWAGGVLGLLIALTIWFVLSITAYFGGKGILLNSSGARRISKEDHPQLFNVVEEMTLAAGLPKMPEVYIIDSMALNAFATGRDPRHSAVAVTAGLLGELDRDQLQGVVGHEIGHIVNRDVLFMQMLGVMAGAIVMISEGFRRGMRGSGRSSSRRGGNAQIVMLIVALVLIILAPILARIIYMAASRKREYLADAQAAVYTRYPEGLASALETIASDNTEFDQANHATAPMYIVNPFAKMRSAAIGLFATHPPTDERIRILRGMAGNASFAEYDRASRTAGAMPKLPTSALRQTAASAIRAAAPSQPTKSTTRKRRSREAVDAVRSAGGFTFLPCSCGLEVKLPPELKSAEFACPRCKRVLTVPNAMGTTYADSRGLEERLQVAHRHGRWETIRCQCGNGINLSPSLEADRVTCPKCGRAIDVVSA